MGIRTRNRSRVEARRRVEREQFITNYRKQPAMNMSELIKAYGDDKVQIQNLDTCIDSLNMNKGITKVTFGTEQPITLDGIEKLGIVVWFDRERVNEIIAAEKAARVVLAAKDLP